ncbi:unnamed protein product [Mytilus coruscus]|uniref:Uncharacterized protein n=1 Tax=Mytilus coruscus TaxID=42192 RepID=A0A6J8D0Y1_MYTCO|nr:unnamed protein product [Mytilus coruscus]
MNLKQNHNTQSSLSVPSKRNRTRSSLTSWTSNQASYFNTLLPDCSVWKPLANSPDTSTTTVISVREFYCAVVKKMVTKFPFHDLVGSCLGFLNAAERGNLDFNDTLKRFQGPTSQIVAVEEELIDYQVTPANELPKFDTDTIVDTYWVAVSAMTNKIQEKQDFLYQQELPEQCVVYQTPMQIVRESVVCLRRYTLNTGHHWTTQYSWTYSPQTSIQTVPSTSSNQTKTC